METCATHPESRAAEPGETRWQGALSVDVDDWGPAVLGPAAAVSLRVVENTRRVLALLAECETCGTFFILGRVAEAFPNLIEEIAAAGHEVASHGHAHELITRQTPDSFRADVARSLEFLERLTGRRPIGYRAPAFSIVAATRWAGPILADLGVRYSSSIFPFAGRRYGIADAPLGVHRWADGRLVEFPPSVLERFGRRWPTAGGGYFRLLPGAAARAALRGVIRAGRPAMVFLHPYEFDTTELAERSDIGWRLRLTQGLFRSRMEARWRTLLRTFRFAPAATLIAEWI